MRRFVLYAEVYILIYVHESPVYVMVIRPTGSIMEILSFCVTVRNISYALSKRPIKLLSAPGNTDLFHHIKQRAIRERSVKIKACMRFLTKINTVAIESKKLSHNEPQ